MKAKDILQEWRNFLKESAYEKFTAKDVEKKIKIKYSPCCEVCVEFLNMPKGAVKTGTLTGHNGNDIEVKGKIVNTIFVDRKMVPQCCVISSQKK